MLQRINTANSFRTTSPPLATRDLDGIRRMLDGCGTSNRNEPLVVAIDALIDDGVDTGSQTVGEAASIQRMVRLAGGIAWQTIRLASYRRLEQTEYEQAYGDRPTMPV